MNQSTAPNLKLLNTRKIWQAAHPQNLAVGPPKYFAGSPPQEFRKWSFCPRIWQVAHPQNLAVAHPNIWQVADWKSLAAGWPQNFAGGPPPNLAVGLCPKA